MAWEVTAELGRFDEATRYFLGRTVLTGEAAAALDLDARQRAFWIGGGLQLAQVQRVFDEIGKAIESGEDFNAWRKRVRTVLRDDAHAETVFRNAVQRSYTAGRYEQMHEPDVLAWRPYFMHDSVLDSRTTETCKKLDGIILPANHEHWQTHWPPGHHRCRRGVRSLRKAEAERRGVTAVPPALNDAPGFGLAPSRQPVWKPTAPKYSPVLTDELEKKKAKPRPKKAKKTAEPGKPPGPPEDLAYWEAHYRKKNAFAKKGYGDASSSLAWGRSMTERGLDRPLGEIVAELDRLHAAGFQGLQFGPERIHDHLRLLPQDQPLRGHVSAEANRPYVALAEHSLTIRRGKALNLGSEIPAVRDAERFYDELLDASVPRPAALKVDLVAGSRAHWDDVTRTIQLSDTDGGSVAVHEIAHAIETESAQALARSQAFLKARTVGEKKRSLRELTGSQAYEADEFAWEDKFKRAYTGKYYSDATELTSMGYEDMMGVDWLVNTDADDFETMYFLFGQLAGR